MSLITLILIGIIGTLLYALIWTWLFNWNQKRRAQRFASQSPLTKKQRYVIFWVHMLFGFIFVTYLVYMNYK
ncbi:hypothetical protein TP70_05570 [Staphylococcus microti]|uniref:Uncharacterized protein n=1 Tax=Staphylococcus microti TaxID=569857 RepID=A0A0D6XR79_9STAP|nr:hypothetical protein TP70_05570 [Staphylococcus microti]PNZ83210.1 hypothetical protein CD132_02885 [Staphylococcus microti]SUM58483.1 Uncharacterised protein [Staphylococcus microti]